MPEVQSRSLMMVEAVVQGQVQAMEAMSEREFVSQDREVAHTWGGGIQSDRNFQATPQEDYDDDDDVDFYISDRLRLEGDGE